MVDRPGQLDAVLGHLPRRVHCAGVVDENVDLRVAGKRLGRQPSHGRLRGQVGDERVDGCAAACLDLTCAAAILRVVALRPTMTTLPPCPARASAAARPMPLVAPVMTMRLPFICRASTDPKLADHQEAQDGGRVENIRPCGGQPDGAPGPSAPPEIAGASLFLGKLRG